MLDTKINTFLTIIDTGGFTNAAKVLELTQPAVSHHIRMLEEQYKIKLFYKNKRKVMLTPEGAILEKYARRGAAIAATSRQVLKDSERGVKHLSIVITPTVGESILPKLIAAYCNRNPNVHVDIVTQPLDKIPELMAGFAADIAIVEGDVDSADLVSVPMDTDYLSLVVAPTHRLAGLDNVNIEQLRDERFVLRPQTSGSRQLFEGYLQDRGILLQDLNISVEIDNVDTIKDLVAHNVGVTVMSHFACEEEQRTGKLAVVPLERGGIVRKINMVHRPDFRHPEVVEEMRSIFKLLGRDTLD